MVIKRRVSELIPPDWWSFFSRIHSSNTSEVLSQLKPERYWALVERGFVIKVEAFDWNCPLHITLRHTQAQVKELITPIVKENQQLKQKLGELQ